jgi:hypothetical protein
MRHIKRVDEYGPLRIVGVHKMELKLRERQGGTRMASANEILVNLFQNRRFCSFYQEFMI